MQADYPASFRRDTAGTEQEWLQRLPGACGARALRIGDRQASVTLDDGTLSLAWQPLPARRMALLTMPRLMVEFRFEGVGDIAREDFMRHFDLYMQRGGG